MKGRHRFRVFAETLECGFQQGTPLEMTRQLKHTEELAIIPGEALYTDFLNNFTRDVIITTFHR